MNKIISSFIKKADYLVENTFIGFAIFIASVFCFIPVSCMALGVFLCYQSTHLIQFFAGANLITFQLFLQIYMTLFFTSMVCMTIMIRAKVRKKDLGEDKKIFKKVFLFLFFFMFFPPSMLYTVFDFSKKKIIV